MAANWWSADYCWSVRSERLATAGLRKPLERWLRTGGRGEVNHGRIKTPQKSCGKLKWEGLFHRLCFIYFSLKPRSASYQRWLYIIGAQKYLLNDCLVRRYFWLNMFSTNIISFWNEVCISFGLGLLCSLSIKRPLWQSKCFLRSSEMEGKLEFAGGSSNCLGHI